MDIDDPDILRLLGPNRPRAVCASMGEDSGSSGRSLSSLSHSDEYYASEIQERRTEYWTAEAEEGYLSDLVLEGDHSTSCSSSDEEEDDGPPPPMSPHPSKIPRFSVDDWQLQQREQLCASREKTLQKQQRALQTQIQSVAADVLDANGDSLYGNVMMRERDLLLRQRRHKEHAIQKLLRAADACTQQEQEPPWLCSVPAGVQEAYRLRSCQIAMNDTVLMRLTRHLDAWKLLHRIRQGDAVLYTLKTSRHYVVMGVEPGTQRLLFYCQIVKGTLALLK